MSRPLFYRIFSHVVMHNQFLRRGLKPDCTGKSGASLLQKVVASLRYLAYGFPADSLDEYVRLGKTTTLQSMKQFCWSVAQQFGPRYLRAPTATELNEIASSLEKLGFPGCIGCLDCVGWDWEQCPKAFQGINVGKERKPTLRMEVICDMDLRIWHLCFGFLGSMNDINILSVSPHFANILNGSYPPIDIQYVILMERCSLGVTI
ncbi:unnamed protein product [Chondrus crispus]|uniref:DDE Tnp4 domain-containing protein n=1 Tax=Chondrus crispus TaxID=2769 RepID=R7QMM6_CHOCR|nr:unnamed protein product [Chondrus crispus]CDF38988.1 unnamed protein product [Chondrus crispus]|eukprot:XP_005718893.1 unnamed protein product [Chondrus crispus]